MLRKPFRVQAVAIGQALIDASFLHPLNTMDTPFRDDFTLYRPVEVRNRKVFSFVLYFVSGSNLSPDRVSIRSDMNRRKVLKSKPMARFVTPSGTRFIKLYIV